MFDTTHPGANGITAQEPKARMKIDSGASRNTALSAPSGMTISFRTNFPKSAKDCIRPKGPTTLGPLRHWTPAQILRSPHSRNASETSTPTMTSRTPPTVIRVQPPGVDQKSIS